MSRRMWQGARVLVLLCLLIALPTTTGWLAVYVLGGIVLLAGGLCFCSCCCSSCCQDPCAGCECDCDCSGCSDPCGDCGDDCCGDCGGEGGSEGCCATMPDSMAMPLVALGIPRARAVWWQHRLAHHPLRLDYAHDVYAVGPLRLCIGCFTTYPVFLLGMTWLLLATPVAWGAWLAGGLALASAQALSSAGLAKRRWQKGAIKTALGLGLAAATYGILASPMPHPWQSTALLGLMLAALASAIPRALRMRRAE